MLVVYTCTRLESHSLRSGYVYIYYSNQLKKKILFFECSLEQEQIFVYDVREGETCYIFGKISCEIKISNVWHNDKNKCLKIKTKLK